MYIMYYVGLCINCPLTGIIHLWKTCILDHSVSNLSQITPTSKSMRDPFTQNYNLCWVTVQLSGRITGESRQTSSIHPSNHRFVAGWKWIGVRGYCAICSASQHVKFYSCNKSMDHILLVFAYLNVWQ